MSDFTADFEAGVNGNTITTAGGEASATAWYSVTGTPTYSNAQKAHGSLSGAIAAADNYLVWDLGSATDWYARIYLYTAGNPSSNSRLFGPQDGSTCVAITTAGKILLVDNVAHTQTGSVSIATGQWIRIEAHFVHSATVGQVEAKLFNIASSSSPSETITSPSNWNTGDTAAGTRFGRFSGGGWSNTFYLDDVVANATSYPGPVAGDIQTASPNADSVDGAWTDQGGGSSLYAAIDEVTYSDSDYIRSEVGPSNSGCRVKLASLSDPSSSSGHMIHWRAGKDVAGGATINMTVKLYQGGGDAQGGGTLIASFARNGVDAFTTYDETLSSGEADSISDYTDLYLEFFANQA